MHEFNVLYSRWIPARGKNGDLREYGLLELLEQSPSLDAVTDASPPFEYGMYRLLLAFLTDIFRPESVTELEDLLDEGTFDMRRIQTYGDRWADRFDLFSKEHPFLQARFDSRWDADENVKPVANLIPELPSGNGHVHFVHRLEKETRICPAVAARALCASMLFTPAMVQGYPSGVNGAPPWFTLIRGKNLFETLVLNLWVPSTNLVAYDERVIWKSDRTIVPKEDVKDISYLEGLLFPNRRILLIPEDGGVCTYSGVESDCLVSMVHYKQGLNFTAYALWIDPHATRRTNDLETSSVKPNAERALWRDIGGMLLQKNMEISGKNKTLIWHRPPVINQLSAMERSETRFPWVATRSYGLALDQAKQLLWMTSDMQAPMSLLTDTPAASTKAQLIQKCLSDAEEAGDALRVAVRGILSMQKDGAKLTQLSTGIYREYWHVMETEFFGIWMPLLYEAGGEEGWQLQLRVAWYSSIKKQSRDLFRQAVDRAGGSGEILMKANHARGYLEAKLFMLNPEKPVQPTDKKKREKKER